MAELRSVRCISDLTKNPHYDSHTRRVSFGINPGHIEIKLDNARLKVRGEFRSPSTAEESQRLDKAERHNILKNLIVLGLAFLFLFTAYQSLQNLQSSLNSDQGLGLASLSVINASLVVSCMFLPPYLIKRFGCKNTLAVSISMYTGYIAANCYATWYTLMPSSVILGMAAAPLWASMCTYLTETGIRYAYLTNKEKAANIIARFFGIFFMIFQSGQIWGNLISSTILSSGNQTSTIDDELTCGAKYCDYLTINSTSARLRRPENNQILILCGIYLGCALIAVLIIIIFLDQLKRDRNEDDRPKISLKILVETLRHLRNPEQCLIIPLTVYSGMEQAFIAGDYTKAYVSCAWGIGKVGFVMICFGLTDALFSLCFGPLVKLFGRVPLFIMGGMLNFFMMITLLLWRPDPDDLPVFFVISAIWGMADAVWQTQINSLYGVLFTKHQEAAFSNFRLWESIGFIIAFAYANFLCIYIKIYILLGVLLLGMIGYGGIELIERNRALHARPIKIIHHIGHSHR